MIWHPLSPIESQWADGTRNYARAGAKAPLTPNAAAKVSLTFENKFALIWFSIVSREFENLGPHNAIYVFVETRVPLRF